MPLGTCAWCARVRKVELQTWRSRKTGEQLCGNVCNHCYFGGEPDACRTCQARAERSPQQMGLPGVRKLGKEEAYALWERMYRPKRSAGGSQA